MTHQGLLRATAGTNLSVLSQQPMRNVIDVANLDITRDERKCWKQSSFDFIVIDSESKPLFAVDFDGPVHRLPEKQIVDLRKLSICSKAQLPIAKIDDDYLVSQEHISILEFMVQRYWYWRQESSKIDEEIKFKVNFLQSMGKSTEEIYDAVLEMEMDFNFDHYYPEYEIVSERLQTKHNLLPEYLIHERAERSSFYHLASTSQNTDSDGYLVGLSRYMVEGSAAKQGARKHIEWEVEATAKIRWSYEKQLESEEYMTYFGKTAMEVNEQFRKELGMFPARYVTSLHTDLPGLSFPDLVAMLAAYKCLCNIEEKCIKLEEDGWTFEQSNDSDMS